MALSITAQKDNVAAKSISYQRMAAKWLLPLTLMQGTKGMREAGQLFLPQEPQETNEAYQIRLKRSFLYNAYRDTVKGFTAKPFSRKITLQGTNIPKEILALEQDVDTTGKTLTQFGRDLFITSVNFGGTHLFVDFPKVPEGATKRDEKQLGARPIFTNVTPAALLGASVLETDQPIPPVLESVRIFETIVVKSGQYTEEVRERVRVYARETWQIFEKQEDSKGEIKWVEISNGTHTFGSVPINTCYLNRTGFMEMEPVLEDLADLNHAHWISSSDQRNILKFARLANLIISGEQDEDRKFVVGGNQVWIFKDPETKVYYAEHSGKAIGAGQQDLETLIEEMTVLGLQPQIRKSGTQTATGQMIDASRGESDVQSWIRAVEDCLEAGFRMAAEWLKVKLPSDFKVNIFNDFALSATLNDDLKTLNEARKHGDISHPTYLNELQRRSVIADSVDIEDEIALTEQENAQNDSMLGIPEELLIETEPDDEPVEEE